MGIILVAVLSTMGRATETATYADQRNEALDQLRVMASTISKDLRQGSRVTAMTQSSVTLDTYVDGALTSVTWRVVGIGDGQRFERLVGTGAASTYVVRLTASTVFNYFGQSDPAAVSRVGLLLTTQLDARHPAIEVATEVELRNV